MALRTLNTKPVARCRLSVASMRSRAISRRRAFTLAESLVASVVLAVAVMGVSSAIVAAQYQLDSQEEDSTAIVMARQLMEHAASLPLTSSDATAGWPTVTSTTSYDTIRDYNGYKDTVRVPIYRSSTLADVGTFSTASPSVTAITGSEPTLARQAYIRHVTVTYPTSIFGTTVTAGDFAVVKVTVRGGGGNGVTLTRIVARNTVQR